MADTYYAWADIHNGGEVGEKRQGNMMVKVVTKANVTPRGEKVTQKDLGMDDDEWAAKIENGSIRNYPVPKGADDYTSPTAAFIASVVNETGDVDINKIMELGLTTPGVAINPPAEAAKEVSSTPKGA